MVADALYAFPSARAKVAAIAGTDQGLGSFLESVQPGFSLLPALDKKAGAESYAALRPGLVILKGALRASLGVNLEKLGIRTMYLELESPEDYYRDFAALGAVFGEEARARELIAYYQDIVARTARAAAGAKKPRVLALQVSGDGYEVPPDTWMQTRMVEMAGGEPVWKGSNPGSGWTVVGPEQIAAWNPDVVLVISYGSNAAPIAAKLAADPRFKALAAVKAGKVLGFPQDYYSWDQPDTRWGLGLLWLTEVLNPGRMPGFSLKAEARRFYSLFYGFGEAAFDANVAPRFTGTW